jgi:hypothetical protein
MEAFPLSIASLLQQFGTTYYRARPLTTVQSDGTVQRSRTPVLEIFAWIQPSGQNQDVFEGRMNSRTAGTMYIEGSVDVAIDDEIYTGTGGTVSTWRVSGAINPGLLAQTQVGGHPLNMTVVEVTLVEPTLVLPE